MLEYLQRAEFVVFSTRDFALASGSSLSAASKRLDRFAAKQVLTKVTKGTWANTNHPHFHPMACVPYLLGKEQGYVSFLTALHLHAVIEQLPRTVQVATTGRGRRLTSPVGTFEFFRIKPELMLDGTEWSETHQPYRIATREKALLDVLYLSTRKNRRFAGLPEIDLAGSGFKRREFERLFRELPYPIRVRSAIRQRWQRLQNP